MDLPDIFVECKFDFHEADLNIAIFLASIPVPIDGGEIKPAFLHGTLSLDDEICVSQGI
jgi:hypothetical protein